MAWIGRLCALVSAMAVAAALGGFCASRKLLLVEHVPTRSDAIVLLGGEAANRVFQAAAVYHRDLAPRIIITGDGDCEIIRERLVMARVPGENIVTECQARNTKENALRTVEIMRRQGWRSGIVITSWFHSRRAYKAFRAEGPDLTWTSAPSYDGMDASGRPGASMFVVVTFEYVKAVWYAVRYGYWL